MKNHYQQWLSKVTPEDSSQNYHNLIDYYLGAIETNPDIITNYWYLGLAYLLDENLTQAQETWFFYLRPSSTRLTTIFPRIIRNTQFRSPQTRKIIP